MFETYDFDYIMGRMLDRVSDQIDKREGSIIYDALAPAAVELADMYVNLDIITAECFADTASYYYLVKRAAERNLYPEEATKAIVKGIFIPDTVDIPIGSRFNLDELNYTCISKIEEESAYRLECEIEGITGNQQIGAILPLEPIRGLETGKITEVLTPGEEEEDVDEFRNRYFSSFKIKAFGGNLADYKEQTKKIDGVGGVKVIPVWNGGGTVKLVIVSSELKPPSADLVSNVQNIIDPKTETGTGSGIAPIGHTVTVQGAVAKILTIETQITFQSGYSFAVMKASIETAIDAYFLGLSALWESEKNLIVRISQIETRLLSLAGVIDINHTKLNGVEENLTIDSDALPVRGDIIA